MTTLTSRGPESLLYDVLSVVLIAFPEINGHRLHEVKFIPGLGIQIIYEAQGILIALHCEDIYSA